MTAQCVQTGVRACRSQTVWLCLAALLVCAGCGGRRMYKSTHLPAEFLMSGVDNVHTVDLTKLASHAAPSNQLGPGDLLEIAVETGMADEVDRASVRVGEDGVAMIPIVGRLPLAGMEPEQAERVVAAAAVERGVYRNPTVTVNVKKQRTNRVTVIGAVNKPDVYELPRASSSLLMALVAAGGLDESAATAVEIRRPGATAVAQAPPADGVTAVGFRQPVATAPVSYHVDLVKAAEQDHLDYPLNDGDIVMIHKRDPQPLTVIGMVNKPGRFDLPANKDMYLLDAIAQAGGVSTQWADKVRVSRHMPGQADPVVIDISMKEAKEQGQGNLRLGPGDVISVEQTPMTVLTGALRTIAPSSLNLMVPLIR